MRTSSWGLLSTVAALLALMAMASPRDDWREETEPTVVVSRQLKQNGHILGLYQGAYTDITTQLRTAILDADLDLAISLLTVNKDPKVLGAGLRFPPGDPSEFLRTTEERVNDPDVIAIKAVAGASLRLSDCSWISSTSDDPTTSNPQVLGILKLAEAFIIAITPDNGKFPAYVNQFKLQVEIITMLADRTLMQQVFDDDPLASTLNRRLLVQSGTPVKTWVCAYCHPGKVCRRGTWWCTK